MAHALPTATTMGQARTPMLVYSSDHADPYPIVRLDVLRDYGPSGTPDSVTAALSVVGLSPDTIARGKWSGSGWDNNTTRRIAVGFDASGATGVYRYTLNVRFWHGNSPSSGTFQGQLSIVNRYASEFGKGWWLAGLETLRNAGPTNDTMVVVGGDGALRQYIEVTSNVWAAANVNRPDTLKYVSGNSTYVRYVPGGTEVVFNATGQHVKTRNRLGHETIFTYTGTTLDVHVLDKIEFPVVSGTKPCYKFNYTNGLLTSVSAPYATSGSLACDGSNRRSVAFTHSEARISTIQDPDEEQVAFGYSGGDLVTSRTNRRGIVTTFSYGAGSRVDTVVVGGALNITTAYTPAETRGLWTTGTATPVLPDSAYTLIDGPRTDLNDHTRIWIDRFGAPTKIRNALGEVTTLTRADPNFPALVTGVEHPNGFVETSGYNARGNVDTLTALDLYGGTADATTVIRYNDGTWPDLPTVIKRPEGDSTVMAYEAGTGNIDWRQPGGDTSRRQTFDYNGNGLLTYAIPPGEGSGDSERFTYDALGNVATYQTPMEFTTSYTRDYVGRVTATRSPIDGTRVKKDSTVYDVMDRPTMTHQSGAIGHSTELVTMLGESQNTVLTLEKSYLYDDEGNLTSTGFNTWADSDSMEYDGANRVTVHHSYSRGTTTTTYGDNVNATSVVSARSHTINMTYDALNRLSVRTMPEVTYAKVNWCDPLWEEALPTNCPSTHSPDFPIFPNATSDGLRIVADTAMFTYDVMGNIASAVNRDASVRRTYYPNSALRTDSLTIFPYTVSSGGVTPGSSIARGSRVEYDLNGRRTRLFYPGGDSIRYAYDPTTAELSDLWDALGGQYAYDYDVRGRPTSIGHPNSVTETRAYDDDDRLTSRGGLTGLSLSLDYSQANQVLEALGAGQSMEFLYQGLGGAIEAQTYHTQESNYLEEQFYLNEHNAVLWSYSQPAWSAPQVASHSPGAGNRSDGMAGGDECIMIEPWQCPEGYSYYERWNNYDDSGNLNRSTYWRWEYINQFEPPEYLLVDREEGRRYYGPDQMLRYSQRHKRRRDVGAEGASDEYRDGEFMEYRYDALGRRVMADTKRSSSHLCVGSGTFCSSFTDYFFWDGDQLLLEDRGTTVRYAHGLELDKPLSVIYGSSERFHPYMNWRGEYFMATNSSGGTYCSTCKIDWPGYNRGAFYQRGGWVRTHSYDWRGSLITGQADASDLLYRRNRYYDPDNAAFSNADPIGAAGGYNLYGYANGDPINLSDPMGLCPQCLIGMIVGGGVAAVASAASGDSFRSPRTWGKIVIGALAGAASGGVTALGARGLGAVGAQSLIGGVAGMDAAAVDGGSLARGAIVGATVSALGAGVGMGATAAREAENEVAAQVVIGRAMRNPGDVRFGASFDDLVGVTSSTLNREGNPVREEALGAALVGALAGYRGNRDR